MKDIIIDVDIIWATEGSPDFIFDGIAEGHSGGKSEGVPADTL